MLWHLVDVWTPLNIKIYFVDFLQPVRRFLPHESVTLVRNKAVVKSQKRAVLCHVNHNSSHAAVKGHNIAVDMGIKQEQNRLIFTSLSFSHLILWKATGFVWSNRLLTCVDINITVTGAVNPLNSRFQELEDSCLPHFQRIFLSYRSKC